MVRCTRSSAGDAPGKYFSAPKPRITRPRLIRSQSMLCAVSVAANRATTGAGRSMVERVDMSFSF